MYVELVLNMNNLTIMQDSIIAHILYSGITPSVLKGCMVTNIGGQLPEVTVSGMCCFVLKQRKW